MTTMVTGRCGEDLAANYLCGLGWTILDRNWRCPSGELDIIACEPGQSRDTTVFVEVKYRTGVGYGDPLEAITLVKQRHLRACAARWLCDYGHGEQARIDAIGIIKIAGTAPIIRHVRGLT